MDYITNATFSSSFRFYMFPFERRKGYLALSRLDKIPIFSKIIIFYSRVTRSVNHSAAELPEIHLSLMRLRVPYHTRYDIFQRIPQEGGGVDESYGKGYRYFMG